ncbi:hypothetical protein X777_06454 [Ooceraea biroi]|uniref:Uncharacterized protein n=1 Tax=Ooceraea biroi TaxID=2015173 RepID=A0A026WBN2_OOCBI|nr:hypothetical protein X777_06454 [Ooceraea biroi]
MEKLNEERKREKENYENLYVVPRLKANEIQDRPVTDRTVALVAKVPNSGRSCSTLRFPSDGAREIHGPRKERCVRKRNDAREEDEECGRSTRRRSCLDLTLRTDIIAWESAISRKRRSDFFQSDFFRHMWMGVMEKRISRVNNDRLVPRACGKSHISDPSREQ